MCGEGVCHYLIELPIYRGGDFYFLLLFLLLINIHVTKIWYKIGDMNRERDAGTIRKMVIS